jgi:hypothetical protein
MSKYGYCPDCGSVMESVGCSNCDELAVIERQSYWDSLPEQYTDPKAHPETLPNKQTTKLVAAHDAKLGDSNAK